MTPPREKYAEVASGVFRKTLPIMRDLNTKELIRSGEIDITKKTSLHAQEYHAGNQYIALEHLHAPEHHGASLHRNADYIWAALVLVV